MGTPLAFVRHQHLPGDCNVIVCWINDWPDCPEKIEIIELQDIIPQLENPVMEEPAKLTELSEHNVDDLFRDRSVRLLYDALHPQIMKIDIEMWRKIAEPFMGGLILIGCIVSETAF